MSRARRNWLVVAAVGLTAASLTLPTANAAQGVPLFTDDVAVASSAALAARPHNASVVGKSVNPDAVAAETISIDLGGRTLRAERGGTRVTASGSTVWTGSEEAADEANSVVLVRSGDTVTGSVRADGKLYRIRPVAGEHALIAVDETKMPPDHEPVRVPTIPMAPAEAGAAADTVIRVQVVATNEAVSGYGGDMRALAELAVEETNRGYANSGVGITLELADYSTVNYAEQSFSTDLSRFRRTGDGYLDGIHSRRDESDADVAMLMLDNSSACGQAASIGSTAATAFAVVHWDCATGYYSFGHEIGHLQSARHDPETDRSTTPYEYGHGYRYGGSWRTIMAYDCASDCPRLNYWSSPDKTYDGVPMGTRDVSDNARVLRNTKATLAGFR